MKLLTSVVLTGLAGVVLAGCSQLGLFTDHWD
jgi:hypothetical protein